MNGSGRQQELEQIIQDALTNNPMLQRALEVFEIGQAEYTRALAAMTTATIVASDSTSLNNEERDNAILD